MDLEKGALFIRPVTDAKAASCLLCMGFELEEKGIWIQYDKENPKQSTGGKPCFRFKHDQLHQIDWLLSQYDTDDAEETLERLFDEFISSKDNEVRLAAQKLKKAYFDSLICSLHHAIDHYLNVMRYLKTEAQQVVITGGEPAHDDDGRVIGTQGFKVKTISR